LKRSLWLDEVLEVLTDSEVYGKFPRDNSLFGQQEIPEAFFSSVRQCAELFTKLQEDAITRCLQYWKEPLSSSALSDLARIQSQVAEKYLALYKVEKVPKHRHCITWRKEAPVSQIDLTTYRGSLSLLPNTRLAHIRSAVQELKPQEGGRFISWVRAPYLGRMLQSPVTGKKVQTVLNSKFCTGRHLHFYNDTLRLLQLEDEECGVVKRRKVDKLVEKDLCKSMENLKDKFRTVQRLSIMFPEIVPITKVLVPSIQTERLIRTILETIPVMEKGQNLLVQGFPLYTRLDITIFFCLAALFEETGFVKPDREDNFFLLSKYLGSSNTGVESVSCLERILCLLNSPPHHHVLSVWSVDDLVQDHIYQEIILFNQTRIKENILFLTS